MRADGVHGSPHLLGTGTIYAQCRKAGNEKRQDRSGISRVARRDKPRGVMTNKLNDEIVSGGSLKARGHEGPHGAS